MSAELKLSVMHFLTYLCQSSRNYWQNICTHICTLGTYGNRKNHEISEKKFSLCKRQKCINKQPLWITKPYMKTFLEEKKDIPNYWFISLCFSCTHKCTKAKNVHSRLPVASNIKKIHLKDKLNLQEHFAEFFVRLYDHLHWNFNKNIHSFLMSFPCWHWLSGCHLGKNS